MDTTADSHNFTPAHWAPHFADVVLDNLARTEPYHLTLMYRADRPVRTPAEIHPAFNTSYDWHSCVHMHWLGVSLLNQDLLEATQADSIRQRLQKNLTEAKLAAEAGVFADSVTFERPYGWGWAARLGQEVAALAATDHDAANWHRALVPLLDAIYANATTWAQSLDYPVRHGVHSNTAFGLRLLINAALALGRDATTLTDAAARLFAHDAGWSGKWEMSGQDFLSPAMTEADLLAEVLPDQEFTRWFTDFLPEAELQTVVRTAVVSNPADPQMVHLYGLNLSRAGSLYRLAARLDPHKLNGVDLCGAADELLSAGLASLSQGEYVSTHWLASFAQDALLSRT